MTSGELESLSAVFSLREFKMLHQVTKEIPNLDPTALSAAGCPPVLAESLLELVRRGRSDIGAAEWVRIRFRRGAAVPDGPAAQVRGDVLDLDSGLTMDAVRAWLAVGSLVAEVLGSPEFDLRIGGTVEQSAAVFGILSNVLAEPAKD